MINNKAASKKKEPQAKASHSADQRLEVDGQSKLFKKLSMSFYNWATKHKDKQVVCEAYEQPATVQLCTSTGSLNSKRKKKPKRPKEPVKNHALRASAEVEPTTEGKHHFNEYYFEGVSKLPKATKPHNHGPPSSGQHSNYFGLGPREVTQIYFRRFIDEGNSQAQHSLSIQRSSCSTKRKVSRKPGKSKSKEPKLRSTGLNRKSSKGEFKPKREA